MAQVDPARSPASCSSEDGSTHDWARYRNRFLSGPVLVPVWILDGAALFGPPERGPPGGPWLAPLAPPGPPWPPLAPPGPSGPPPPSGPPLARLPPGLPLHLTLGPSAALGRPGPPLSLLGPSWPLAPASWPLAPPPFLAMLARTPPGPLALPNCPLCLRTLRTMEKKRRKP